MSEGVGEGREGGLQGQKLNGIHTGISGRPGAWAHGSDSPADSQHCTTVLMDSTAN